VVDYDLDDGKGTDVVRFIREHQLDVAIVAVSAHDHGNRELLDAGADTVCAKGSFDRVGEVLERFATGGRIVCTGS